MDESVDVDKQFLQLRLLTEQTGALHELQVRQLQMWILTVADFFKDYKIAWDGDEKLVEYRLIKANLAKAPKDLKERFDILLSSIRWMLGSEYNLRVVTPRKKLYDSTPKEGKKERRLKE